jgi:hypothetical protein
LLIPHKGKNKGKYISFHYLRGWKARKIRKVQEILYKSRQPEPAKPSRSLIQDKINEGKIATAQIKSQGQ